MIADTTNPTRPVPHADMLYRTAVVTQRLVDGLKQVGDMAANKTQLQAGAVVAVEFAWHECDGRAVYRFGLSRDEWLGVASWPGLTQFVL
ncbi:hypothetical protein ACVNIS_24920 (plasmid) [Sphaerotilaceae bacterium SBD11-9]